MITSLLLFASIGQIISVESTGTVTEIIDPVGWCTDSPFVNVGDPVEVSFSNPGFSALRVGPYSGVVSTEYLPPTLELGGRVGGRTVMGLWEESGGYFFIFYDGTPTDPPQQQYDDCTVRFGADPFTFRQVGDSDYDGQFDSADLVQVFAAGEYEDSVRLNSTWATGDWQVDGEFNSADMVLAFQDGRYEQPTAAATPEPATAGALAGLACIMALRRSRPARPC